MNNKIIAITTDEDYLNQIISRLLTPDNNNEIIRDLTSIGGLRIGEFSQTIARPNDLDHFQITKELFANGYLLETPISGFYKFTKNLLKGIDNLTLDWDMDPMQDFDGPGVREKIPLDLRDQIIKQIKAKIKFSEFVSRPEIKQKILDKCVMRLTMDLREFFSELINPEKIFTKNMNGLLLNIRPMLRQILPFLIPKNVIEKLLIRTKNLKLFEDTPEYKMFIFLFRLKNLLSFINKDGRYAHLDEQYGLGFKEFLLGDLNPTLSRLLGAAFFKISEEMRDRFNAEKLDNPLKLLE